MTSEMEGTANGRFTREDLTRLNHLVGLVYSGAMDPSRWTKQILPEMADFIGAPTCMVLSDTRLPRSGGYLFSHGMSPELFDVYVKKFRRDDVWIKALFEKSLFLAGNVVIGDELISRARLCQSKFYRDYLSLDKNLAQTMMSILSGTTSPNAAATCSFFRGFHQPNFGEEERARQRMLLPHLTRSLALMQHLQSARVAVSTALEGLDRLSSGVLLLDDSGAVAFANRMASRILEAGNGLRLRKLRRGSAMGELVGEEVSVCRAINAAISAALKRDPQAAACRVKSVRVPGTSGPAGYTLQFSAIGEQSESRGVWGAFAAIVVIVDGGRKIDVDPTVLQNAFGLTAAEARVAIALLEHSSAKEVAASFGGSPLTVRTQIRSIYAKLGVDTRIRFVTTILGVACLPIHDGLISSPHTSAGRT